MKENSNGSLKVKSSCTIPTRTREMMIRFQFKNKTTFTKTRKNEFDRCKFMLIKNNSIEY